MNEYGPLREQDSNAARPDVNDDIVDDVFTFEGLEQMPFTRKFSQVSLAAMAASDERVREQFRLVNYYRAARGGTSGVSQTARSHLESHDLLSTPLDKARVTLMRERSQVQHEYMDALLKLVGAGMALELNQANLDRCEEAIAARKQQQRLDQSSKLYAEARRFVDRAYKHGIMEGHWPTMRESTFHAFVAALKADHAAANWGSADAPRFGRKAKKKGRG